MAAPRAAAADRMRYGALIWNPAAGRGRAARLRDAARAVLAAAGWQIDAMPTDHPGHATELARTLAHEGRVEAVFAWGGDGTLREVGAGLLGSDVALAPLPRGTANVLVRALGVPLRVLDAARVLATAPRRPLAVGLCGATPFLMMVSAGLDAAVITSVSSAWKGRLGRAAIVARGLGVWSRYAFPPITARWDEHEAHGTFVAVCNIPLYGGPFRMAPAARLDDDRLELVLLQS